MTPDDTTLRAILEILARLARAEATLDPPPKGPADRIPVAPILELLRRLAEPVASRSAGPAPALSAAPAPLPSPPANAGRAIPPKRRAKEPAVASFFARTDWEARRRGAPPLRSEVRRVLVGDEIDEALLVATRRRRSPDAPVAAWFAALAPELAPARRAARAASPPPPAGAAPRSASDVRLPPLAPQPAPAPRAGPATQTAPASRSLDADVRSFFAKVAWGASA